jgi:hypothetical protein
MPYRTVVRPERTNVGDRLREVKLTRRTVRMSLWLGIQHDAVQIPLEIAGHGSR